MDWGDDVPPGIRGARDQLELADGACGVTDAMTDRLLEGAAALGVTTVDPRARFAGLQRPPYWRRDLHLSVEGHRVLAEQLRPLVAARVD